MLKNSMYRIVALLSFISLLIFAGPLCSQAQNGQIIADGAELTLLSDQFGFTEGPVVDTEGNLFFTDQPNNAIWKYGSNGEFTLFMEGTGRSNGMDFDNNGNLLTCADDQGEVWSISPDKEVTVLVDGYQGKQLNGPNDLWVDPKGGIYITDPYFPRDYWDDGREKELAERVYYLTPDRQELIVVEDELVKPNGIIGSSDGKTLYIGDMGGRATYSYRVEEDGRLTNKKLITENGSDGMTLDEQGNVYLTGFGGVTVFNENGEQIERITVPQGWTANVTFGGPDRQTLFITASKALYSLRMNVKGVR